MKILPTVMVSICLAGSLDAACRQALALGMDVSGSVDSQEYRLQLDGLAAALLHPEVRDAFLSMPGAPVRLAAYEWSGPEDQTLLIEWRDIHDIRDLAAVADTLRSTQRTPAEQSTALGDAMLYGAELLDQQSACWRRTLDISGDGKSNTGPDPQDISDTLLSDITLNALVVGADNLAYGDTRHAEIAELSSYFNAFVIHGMDSFVEVALGFEDFEAAMVRKLKRELSSFALSSIGTDETVAFAQ